MAPLEIPNMRKITVGFAVAALALAGLSTSCRGPAASAVEVKISLPGTTGAITRASVLVDYSKSGAKPQISASGPACTSILPAPAASSRSSRRP